MDHALLAGLSLVFAGLLAGIEFIVRFGVRGPIKVLETGPQIRFRQALIRSLRVPVPIVFLGALASGVAVTLCDANAFRYVAMAALFVWTLATFAGTVPINKAVLAWLPDAPPANWQARIKRWERLDSLRTFAALLAFAFLVAATLAPPIPWPGL